MAGSDWVAATVAVSWFLINGGKPLSGTIEVAANKNAILPMMAASLLTEADCVISNVPAIADVFVMAELPRSVGAAWTLSTTDPALNTGKVIANRSGPSLGGEDASLGFAGGPAPGPLWSLVHAPSGGTQSGPAQSGPISRHFNDGSPGTWAMGITTCGPLTFARRPFSRGSVGDGNRKHHAGRSTVPGMTVVKNAACEPHVENLACMLQSMGVGIEGAGTNRLTINGAARPGPADCDVWPDHTEAGTFAALGAACGNEITIKNVRGEHLENVLLILQRMGLEYELKDGCMIIRPSQLKAVRQIVTGPGRAPHRPGLDIHCSGDPIRGHDTDA